MDAEALLKRYEKASQRRSTWLTDWEDCYTYGLPGRDSFYTETPGESRTTEVYDDTAIVALQDYASMMVEGAVSGRFVELEPGASVPDNQKQRFRAELQEVLKETLTVMRNSNFVEQAHEGFLDLGIGTGNMLILPSNDAKHVNYRSVPLHEVTLDVGPFGDIDGVFRAREVEVDHIQVIWPKARVPEQLKNPRPDQKKSTRIIEACYRDWSKPRELVFKYRVLDQKLKEILHEAEYRGDGSKPWVNYRWSRASGEIYGRGPLLNCLNSVRATNLLMQMTFENADIAIGGVWTMEHDGVVNPDTISIESGTIIPHMPGSKGLRGVQSPSNLDFSSILLEDQRTNIKRALFVEDYDNGGKTPISAEEVEARRAQLSRRIGSPFHRVFTELIVPALKRTMFILKSDGIIEIPKLDGREVDIEPTSPLARAARAEEAMRKFQYTQGVQAIVGPENLKLFVKPELIIRDLTQLAGQPEEYLVDDQEREQLVGQAAQVMGAMQGGQPPQ